MDSAPISTFFTSFESVIETGLSNGIKIIKKPYWDLVSPYWDLVSPYIKSINFYLVSPYWDD